MTAAVALRIDVDTHRGLAEGVPRLLALLRAREVRASFYVTMGPDRAGHAVRQLWRPSFVVKMWRSRAWRVYGLRTLVSGTLAPARRVGAGQPALLRDIIAGGHELAPHGFDHRSWQDLVHRRPSAWIRADLLAAAKAFEAAVGQWPEATAAPGWRMTPQALAVQEEMGYRYASDVRGVHPFRPRIDGTILKTIQVPTTMPTSDELMGRVRDVARAWEESLRPGLNVLTAHAEVEGGPLLATLAQFLDRARGQGASITRVGPLAEAALADPALEEAAVGRGRVPGRSGWVAVPEADSRR
jgi:peptidoglycan/xylan/chitin deacetylase (PgdA/CDA1 family)